MTNDEPTALDASETQEIARQADVELAILLGIEKALRIALQWMTRGRGNIHKLSTLRFHTSSFQHHLSRIRALADHGGYLHAITDQNPDYGTKVDALRIGRDKLHASLERIIVQMDHVSRDDAAGFGQVCADLERFLDHLRTHGQEERTLLRHSFTQEAGEFE